MQWISTYNLPELWFPAIIIITTTTGLKCGSNESILLVQLQKYGWIDGERDKQADNEEGYDTTGT